MATYIRYKVDALNMFNIQYINQDLYKAIKEKVEPVNCVVMMAGVYSTYSEWINKEIEIAKFYQKPILAIEPWGASKTSQIVKNNADATVKWNSASIVDAIREYSI